MLIDNPYNMNLKPEASICDFSINKHIPLTDDAIHDLLETLRCYGHYPSDDMIAALHSLLSSLEAMASGTLDECIYLSALDPGVGKTQALYSFTRCLLKTEAYNDVGVFILLGRLEEIHSFVKGLKDAGVPSGKIAVLTSDKPLNALGTAVPDEAQILITTQQRFELQQKDKSFVTNPLWFYRGAVRQVRVWDEAFIPNKPVVLDADDISSLLKPLSRECPQLRGELRDLFNLLEAAEDGSLITLPQLTAEAQAQAKSTLGVPDLEDWGALKRTLQAVLNAAGKPVGIRKGFGGKNSIADYTPVLPPDLLPVVVLDASGRVSASYRDMEAQGALVRLPTATKSYGKLTVHTMAQGAGKRSYLENRNALAMEIAAAINGRPNEKWLVVLHHTPARLEPYEKVIRKYLCDEIKEVNFITWGSHMATNAYVDCPNVILVGTNAYSTPQYEALKRAACSRSGTQGPVTLEEIAEYQQCEAMHHMLQAACRGSVRRCENGGCPSSNLYIIAAAKHRVDLMAASVFPGATIVKWQPVQKPLSGWVGKAIAQIRNWTSTANVGDCLPFKEVVKLLNISPASFKKDVRAHGTFQAELKRLGIAEVGNKRMTAFAYTGHQ